MSAVKNKNTAPEMLVRRLLHSLGYRYRLHSKKLPGKPDIVFGPRKKVVFVHGCFWHGHECRMGRLPSTRREFWQKKIAANRERDKLQQDELTALGWRYLVIWECETPDAVALTRRLREFLS